MSNKYSVEKHKKVFYNDINGKKQNYSYCVHTRATTAESIGFFPIPIQIITAQIIITTKTRTVTW